MVSDLILAGIPVSNAHLRWTSGRGDAHGSGTGYSVHASLGRGAGCGRGRIWGDTSVATSRRGDGRGYAPGSDRGDGKSFRPFECATAGLEVLTWLQI